MTAAETAIKLYLESPPFYGNSSFHSKDTVKKLCQLGDDWKTRAWDSIRKVWGTKSLVCVRRLIESGMWTPIDLDPAWVARFVREVDKRIKAHEAAATKKAAAKSAKARAESTATTGDTVSFEEKVATQRAREKGVIASTKAEIATLVALGLSEQTISLSSKWDHSLGSIGVLGPSAGISPAGRILRLMSLRRQAVRTDHPDIYFDSDKLAPFFKASDRATAAALESVARETESKKRQLMTENATPRNTAPRHSSPSAPLQVEEDLEEEEQDHSSDYMYSNPSTFKRPNVSVTCRGCKQIVMHQFLDCSCCVPGCEDWELCTACGFIVNRILQPCRHMLMKVV